MLACLVAVLAATAAMDACPPGFTPYHPAGYLNNSIPGPPGHPSPVDHQNNTGALCAAKCRGHQGCVGFEVYHDGTPADGACYIFVDELQPPFTPFTTPTDSIACIVKSYPPPPLPTPPPPPPQRGKTSGHPFPRLGNCWGADPYITPEMWDYVGIPNVTNSSWGLYDTLYLNPFDSCCWASEKADWRTLVQAIKQANPNATLFATFHATEIWEADLAASNRWLPEECLMRNADGSKCSWWVGMVFTNNLFLPQCLEAAVTNAMSAMDYLVDAGVDGVFLDGVVNYNLGCTKADVNCTSARAAGLFFFRSMPTANAERRAFRYLHNGTGPQRSL